MRSGAMTVTRIRARLTPTLQRCAQNSKTIPPSLGEYLQSTASATNSWCEEGGTMRTRVMTIGTLLLLSVAILAAPQSQNGGDAVFRDCRVKEILEVDIPAAIGLCERVVREFGSNRALAVDALLEL